MRAIILSDIHLGPGGAFTLFRERDALVELLRWVQAGDPTELILAGDVFDFLQCEDYQGFDATKAASRLTEIIANPDTKAVLNALAAVQADPRHRLVVMSGNHDPELVLPLVRAALSAALGGAPVWADDAPLRARSGEDPPVWGRALPLGTGAAWVVHGDRWDTQNFIDREGVALAAAAGGTVRLPAGSHLVFEVLSQVTPDHPWVHELKPEFPAVLLLLLYLEPRRTMRYLREHFGLAQDLMCGVARATARRGPLFAPEARPDPSPDDLARWIGAQVGRELDGPQAVAGLESWLRYGRADGALASHDGPQRALLRAWLRLIREQDRFGDVDGPDRIPGDAARFLPPEVRLLVAGHTHGRRALAHAQFRYLNTGTWLPVTRLPDDDLTTWIDRLEVAQGWESTSPRTFAVVEPDGGAALMTWSDAHRAEEVARA